MANIRSLTDTISGGLNRNVSDTFLESVIGIYKRNATKDQFITATAALGFPNLLSESVYSLINDNIGKLDIELSEKGKRIGKTEVSVEHTVKEKPKTKRSKLALDFDFDNLDSGPTIKPTDEFKTKKKLTFKKIKKEDAKRMKQIPSKQDELPMATENAPQFTHEHQSSNSTTENNIAVAEERLDPASSQNEELFLLNMTDDIENDRDWYTLEDATYAAVEQYEDLDSEYRPRQKPEKPRSNRTGGGFDIVTGNYVDYDHDDGAMNNTIPIISHFLVPPFLQDSEEFLQLQDAQKRTTRSLGPTISPIKDPSSELAVSARTGSLVVKERKEKKERAQQAKDRSTLQGSAIGGVLGVDEDEVSVKKEPVNEESLSSSFEEIQNQRKLLPAYSVKDELMRIIAENQIVVVIGETGSGKTTQLTQFLCEEGYGKNLDKDGSKLLIGCTQPRRVAAMSVAKRVSEEMGCKLGEEVGYSIRFEDKTDPRKTKIKYLTEGILLREMLADPNLENYSCIIMDEAHERTLNTDILLGLFRKLLRRRRDMKLIVTSATMNADRFTRFFGNAPQYFIPGRTFPVDVFYSKSSCSDYVETTVKQVVTIHLANKKSDGDILVFMTGQEDIEATCDLIQEKLALLDNPPPLDIFPIYSTLPQDLQKRIFNKQNAERRKVVVATNIAETSLTVDGVKYVVDCGLVKMKLFNPKLGMDALQMVPISLANAQQRSGRAGRTGPGFAYRLYTEKAASEDEMYVQPIPEIQRANLSSVMLMLKSLKVSDVMDFPFLDPPPQDLLSCSLYDLWAMGAVDNHGNLTEMGSKLTLFPMEPTLAKLILLSCQKEFLCSSEIVTIVSMLSVPNVFYRPKERAQEADSIREKFLVADLDHLTLLNVYTQWEQRGRMNNMTPQKLATWSSKNFLHHRSLVRARDIRNQIILILAKNNYSLTKAKDDADIRRCLCAAYFHQLAKLVKMNGGGRGQAEYANLRQTYMKMYLHPTSALAGGTDISPQYVVYDELVLTTKEYMQCATAVDPEWLLQYGYLFYGVSSRTKHQLQGLVDFPIVDKQDLEKSLKREPERNKVQTVDKPKTMKMRRF